MCRLLFVKSGKNFEISTHLRQLAEISKNSKEYQGHGWGCAYLSDSQWEIYKNIKPIWEDNLQKFGNTMQLVAHTRSAFKNQDITIENNMPFYADKYVFIFNGELRGVKIRETGRTGAEKIFKYIKRFDKGDMFEALQRGIKIIKNRTKYIKAINIIISDKRRAYVTSFFSEDPDYFSMQYKQTNAKLIICSEKYPNEENWKKIKNNTIKVFE